MDGEQPCKKGLGGAVWQQLHRSQQTHEGKAQPGQGKHRWPKEECVPLCLEVVLECCVHF